MQAEKTEDAARRGRVGNRLLVALAVAGLLLAAVDLLFERYTYFAVEALPGFYALVGAAACVASLAVARVIRRLAMRSEDGDDR